MNTELLLKMVSSSTADSVIYIVVSYFSRSTIIGVSGYSVARANFSRTLRNGRYDNIILRIIDCIPQHTIPRRTFTLPLTMSLLHGCHVLNDVSVCA